MHLCHCEGVGYQSICGGLDHQEMDVLLGRLLQAQDGLVVSGLCVLPRY